jgi:hypothetical protein
LTDSDVISPLEYEEVVFGMPFAYRPKDVYVDVRLAKPERLSGFYLHSVFKSLTIFDQYPVNMNISAEKQGPFKQVPKHKMVSFYKAALTISIKFWKFTENIPLNKTAQVLSSEK